jgi:hypothetical protein
LKISFHKSAIKKGLAGQGMGAPIDILYVTSSQWNFLKFGPQEKIIIK